MADGKEESVDRQVVAFLVGLTLALHQMSTFYTILTIESYGIMLVQYFNLRVLLHALFHDVRCSEEWLSYYHVYFLTQPSQISCLLACRVAAAHDGNNLLAIEESVAGGTC